MYKINMTKTRNMNGTNQTTLLDVYQIVSIDTK